MNALTLMLPVLSCSILIFMNCNPNEPLHQETSNGVISGIPSIPDSLIKEIKKYQNTRAAHFQGWLPDDNGMIILTRFSEMNQIHIVNHPGGARYQMTYQSEPVISASICPDLSKKQIFFLQDSGGNENFQIYSLDYDNKSIKLITDGHSQNEGIVWSNRGDRFVYQSTRRNGLDWDIYICSTGNPSEPKMIFPAGGAWSSLDWSPDDRQLLLCKYVSRTASFMYTFDIASGIQTPLYDSLDTISQESGKWSSTGDGVFLTSDKSTDFRSLRYYDLKTKKEINLTENIHWDVREIAISRDRALLAFTTNEHGFSGLYLMDTRTFKYRKADGLPSGVIGDLQFHPDKKLLGFTMYKPERPEDAYDIDLNSFSITQWTQSETGELDSSKFVLPEIIQYPTFDSYKGGPPMIPCFVYRPKGAGPFPVLILIHGGPESQFWPYFSPIIQFYTGKLKIAVIAPNVRGSGGYGKKYLSLDNGLNRENSVKDIGALLKWIERQTEYDKKRIAVMGGSYGGYMALASMIQYSDKLRAGIDLYGISNYITFLENTAPYRRELRRVEYGDERDPVMRKFLKDISPVTNASHIKCPLLIIQGANDPRVPAKESQQIADAVRRNKGTVWFLMYGNEGHGFRRKENKDYQESVIALFLKKFLL